MEIINHVLRTLPLKANGKEMKVKQCLGGFISISLRFLLFLNLSVKSIFLAIFTGLVSYEVYFKFKPLVPSFYYKVADFGRRGNYLNFIKYENMQIRSNLKLQKNKFTSSITIYPSSI